MPGLDSNTVFLCHANGTDGSTSFVDSSPTNKTITPVGDAQIDTADFKFGGASALFDGNDYLIIPDSTDWDFVANLSTANTWTIDFWFKTILNGGTAQFIYDQRQTGTDNKNRILINESKKLVVQLEKPGHSFTVTSNSEIPINQWTHIAVTIRGTGTANELKIFINGILDITSDNNITNTINGTVEMGRAHSAAGGTQGFFGWLDEFRVSKTIRWTENFNPPTEEYNGISSPPENLNSIAISDTEIDLSWEVPVDDSGNPITGYRIDRSLDGNDWTTIVPDTGNSNTTYSDTGLTRATLYFYRVAAINSEGESGFSNVAAETTFSTAPSAPQNLTATTQDNASILLEWEAPVDDGGEPITGYKIYVESPIGGGFIVLVENTMSTDTSYLDTDLQPNTEYNYKIRAINSVGEGPFSNEASAKTLGFERHIDKLNGKIRFSKRIGGRVYFDILNAEFYIRI